MVIKGKGMTLLSKGTAEKLNVLRMGPVSPGVYLITSEGTEADVRKQFNMTRLKSSLSPREGEYCRCSVVSEPDHTMRREW